MVSLPTQKQSIWQILCNSIKLWRAVLIKLFLFALICSIITSIPHYYVPTYYLPHFKQVLQYIVKHPFIILFYAMVSLIIFAAILHLVMTLLLTNKINYKQAFILGFKKLPFTLFALIAVLCTVFIFTNLLVFPGLFMSILLSMYLPLIIFENEGPFHAYKHSCKLVWNDWWRTAVTLAIPSVIFWTITNIIEGRASFEVVAKHAHSNFMWVFYHLIFTILYAGFLLWAGAILLLLLNDLKLRKGEKGLQISILPL